MRLLRPVEVRAVDCADRCQASRVQPSRSVVGAGSRWSSVRGRRRAARSTQRRSAALRRSTLPAMPRSRPDPGQRVRTARRGRRAPSRSTITPPAPTAPARGCATQACAATRSSQSPARGWSRRRALGAAACAARRPRRRAGAAARAAAGRPGCAPAPASPRSISSATSTTTPRAAAGHERSAQRSRQAARRGRWRGRAGTWRRRGRAAPAAERRVAAAAGLLARVDRPAGAAGRRASGWPARRPRAAGRGPATRPIRAGAVDSTPATSAQVSRPVSTIVSDTTDSAVSSPVMPNGRGAPLAVLVLDARAGRGRWRRCRSCRRRAPRAPPRRPRRCAAAG